MNTNPQAKRILCFGDSLTYGSDHEKNRRLGVNERWTGVLQTLLGDTYEIIEEGMGGRTTDLDDPKQEGRNGLAYFKAAMVSHTPVDLVVILLGTNNLKAKFNQTPKKVASAFEKYDEAIKVACNKWGHTYPQVLLIAPPIVNETRTPKDWGFEGAREKSKLLAGEYSKIANKLGMEFLDLAPVVHTSPVDGVHLQVEENKKLAEVVDSKVKDIFET